jgi:hypothetical protein
LNGGGVYKSKFKSQKSKFKGSGLCFYSHAKTHPNFEKITAATPKTLFFFLPFVSFVSYFFGTLRERGSFISRLELKKKINLHIWDAPKLMLLGLTQDWTKNLILG